MNEEALNEVRKALGIDTPEGVGLEVATYSDPMMGERVQTRLVLMSIDPGYVTDVAAALDASPLADQWRQRIGLQEFKVSYIVNPDESTSLPRDRMRHLLASRLAHQLAEELVTKIEWGITRLDAERRPEPLGGPQRS